MIVIVIGALAVSAGYVIWRISLPPLENIRIGVCADLDMFAGREALQGAILAAEQTNAEGGILGRNVTIVSEDDDSETQPYDIAVATNALTKLATVENADFIIANGGGGGTGITFIYQDICSEHKKILFTLYRSPDEYTQRVVDDYEKYRYYFRTNPTNQTTISEGMIGDILTVRNYTGFTKIALLFQDGTSTRQIVSDLNESLPRLGFQIVYNKLFAYGTVDFASYLAAIEEAGTEILVPYIGGQGGVSFVKEWYDRQSPCIVWGVILAAQDADFWQLTQGKCDSVSFPGYPVVSGYPLTGKTLPTREAYIARWGKVPTIAAIGAYDTLRFILFDALRRAGTTETESVIKALEETDVETSSARHFVFTSSHDVLVGSGSVNNLAEDYTVMCIFQWQNGTQVPVKPESIMEEAGATYKYPQWNGPWDNSHIP